MRKNFCSLFDITNEHIMKEQGLIPWGMKEYYGCDAFLATYDNGGYTNLQYLPGLRMEFIPRRFGIWLVDSVLWLMKNAKRIDILYVLHLRIRTFVHMVLYRLLNPHGKIYLKCDGLYPKRYLSRWKMLMFRWQIRHSECISIELPENAALMSEQWQHRFAVVPNPVNPNEIQTYRPFSQRSNTILTVGRLGTKQKATEILLEAFVKIADQIPDWTLKLAGYIAENMNIASDFYAAHPELKERVIFTGEIRDRQTLMDMYRDTKIFAFPSRHESFGIALTEAMMQGCFAVATDISSSRSLTENFRYALGSPVDDVDGLAKNLLYACTHESEIEALAQEAREATLRRCDLKRVCDVIAEGVK